MRTRTKHVVVYGAMLAAALVIALLTAHRDTDAASGAVHDPGNGNGAPSADPHAEQDTRIDTTPFQPAAHRTIQVIDTLSKRSLENVGVLDGTSLVQIGVSDREGKVDCAEELRPQMLELHLPETLGGLRIAVDTTSLDWSQPCVVVAVEVFAKLVVRAVCDDQPCTDATVRVATAPELPDPSEVSSALYDSLQRLTVYPDLLLENLVKHKLIKGWTDTEIAVDGETAVFWLPYEGALFLSAFGPSYVPDTITDVYAKRGETTTLELRLERKPTIRGRLQDLEGRPLAGQRVFVAARSLFEPEERIPHARREPSNPGYVIVESLKTRVRTVVATKEVTTDAQGRFEIRFPFTDHVAAYAFLQGCPFAFTDRRLDSRTASVDDLVCVASPHSGSPTTVLVLDDSDRPVANATFSVLKSDPIHPFQIQLPLMTTDAKGNMDVSYLEQGKYTFFDRGEEQRYLILSDVRFPTQGPIHFTAVKREE